MKLSIIIPVYNEEKYLKTCLNAVMSQRVQNIEVILVDDGSTDGSPAICDEAAKQDGRIHVIHQPNRGLSAARNAGLDIARGEWIGFVDSDDYPLPEMFEKLLDAAEKHHADIAVCNYFRVDKENQRVPSSGTRIEDGVLTQEEVLRKVLIVAFQISNGKVYRRHIFDGLRYPEDRINEDFFLITKIYSRAERVACISDALYAYRITPGSIMQRKKTLKNYDVVKAADECFQFFLDKGMYDMLPECERATFNGLRSVYFGLDEAERKAPETKAAKKMDDRQIRKLLRLGRLPIRTLCRGILFSLSPTLYRKTRDGQ